MIHVPYLPSLDLHSLRDVPAQTWAQLPAHPIACANWKAYPYIPRVAVKIASTPSHLLLHYDVQEKCIRAKYTQCNQAVWTDSCVEFFISLDEKNPYYNFEFNCIGVPLMRYNLKPHEGPHALPELLSTILTESSLGNQPIECKDGDFAWQLTVAIPFACFFAHPLSSLRGQTVFANAYKCGDELTEPHYLSLFPIHTPAPNFHVPEFFQPLRF